MHRSPSCPAGTIAFLVVTLGFVAVSAAQPEPPRLTAPRVDEAPTIDGHLTEPLWKQAALATGFTQRRPDTGEPARQPTEVWFVYTTEALYVGFVCHDDQPNRIVHNALGRDQALWDDDYLAVVLDTFHDHQNGYLFHVNPNGVRSDALFRDQGQEQNPEWDGVWKVVTHVTTEGWQGEIEIPWRTLRFPGGAVTMGLNIERQRRWINEQSSWVPLDRQFSVFRVSGAGVLEGLSEIQPGRNIVVQPYVLGRVERGHRSSSAAFDTTSWESDVDLGLDLKVGLTSSLTLDLTLNPDFAQVEVDDQVVNLTRFPLFFPEKREFFLEKRDFFNFGSFSNRPFFSRTIGLVEIGKPGAGQPIPIRYGVRLTGKVGRNDLGAMYMETAAQDVIPQRNFQVLRASRDVGRRSRVGFIGARRAAKELNRVQEPTNLAGGVDADLGLTDEIDLRLFTAVSDTAHDGPDNMTWGAGLTVVYPSWNATVIQEVIGVDYNPEMGFVPRPGINQTILGLGHTPEPNWRFLRRFESHANFQRIERRHDALETRYTHIHPIAIGPSEANLGIFFDNTYESLVDTFRVEGGEVAFPAGGYDFNQWGLSLGSDPSRTLALSMWGIHGGFFDGDRRSLTLTAAARWAPHLTTALDWERDRIQRDEGGQEQRFDSDVVRLRIEVDVTNAFNLALFTQWNKFEELVLSQFRAHYLFGNESDLYFVVTDGRDDSNNDFAPRRGEWTVKLNYAIHF